METKKDIRKHVLKKRDCMSKEEWEESSRKIYEKVVSHPFFLNADTIYCYMNYRNEVDTRHIIKRAWELHKKVAIPKVDGDEMHFYYISDFTNLLEGYRGIQEPKTKYPANDENALMIMPGVAFDKNRNRIGYGKGFYDKYLDKHPKFQTIARAFSCQITEEMKPDAFDYKPKIIITEDYVYDK